MKITRIKKSVVTLMGFALLHALCLQAETNVVYFDPFSGPAGTPLNGTAPQDHGGIGADLWVGPDTGLDMDGSVTISWPAAIAGYTLTSTPVLGPSAMWQAVPGTPVASEGYYRQTIPVAGTQYFRLQK